MIKYDYVVIAVILVTLLLFMPYFLKSSSQDSRFSGNVEYFSIVGQNFPVQFNAKVITLDTIETKQVEFYSVKNFHIDNNTRNERESIKIQYN